MLTENLRLLKAIFCTSLLILSSCNSCDPEGRKVCAWVLEPDPERMDKVQQGFVPVCARNRETNKEDCRLQATLDQAKEFEGKKFRYVDLLVESPALPRTIVSCKFCE